MPYYIAQPDPGFHVQAKSTAKHSQAASFCTITGHLHASMFWTSDAQSLISSLQTTGNQHEVLTTHSWGWNCHHGAHRRSRQFQRPWWSSTRAPATPHPPAPLPPQSSSHRRSYLQIAKCTEFIIYRIVQVLGHISTARQAALVI